MKFLLNLITPTLLALLFIPSISFAAPNPDVKSSGGVIYFINHANIANGVRIQYWDESYHGKDFVFPSGPVTQAFHTDLPGAFNLLVDTTGNGNWITVLQNIPFSGPTPQPGNPWVEIDCGKVVYFFNNGNSSRTYPYSLEGLSCSSM